MLITKRNGFLEPLNMDKIQSRLEKAAVHGQDITPILKTITNGLVDKISSKELDEIAVNSAAALIAQDPDYDKLAVNIMVSRMHKEKAPSFTRAMEIMYNEGLLAEEFFDRVLQMEPQLNEAILPENDYLFTYFGLRTLQNKYIHPYETPQHMFMRVSLALNTALEDVLNSYHAMSEHRMIHATPTLQNAGFRKQSMASCYLQALSEDSMEGIYTTLKQTAMLSKNSGGIGLHIHNVRAKGSIIASTGAASDGIVPMLRVFNETARYASQGGRRKGAFAVYLEPWHADIFEFLELRKNHGKEELRTRDLFTALWIPDLFMKRVQADGDWSLFCPNESPGLADCYGEAFETLYSEYEAKGKARRTIKARELWFAILESQIETGTPYMLYKDACNEKSEHSRIGIIKSSNLCAEILLHSDKDHTAVCVLGSVSLPAMIANNKLDETVLAETVQQLVRNLNGVITTMHYASPESELASLKYRPLGIGIQGLADYFHILKLAFDSPEALKHSERIAQVMQEAAIEASEELAYKAPGWSRANSTLLAFMPTASTSQILGNNECFEPYTSNCYVRRTQAGEFIIFNTHLVKELKQLGLWSPLIRSSIIASDGSIQQLDIPEDIKNRYKTVWELSQRTIIDHAAIRQPYICQSQSMNLWLKNPSIAKLSSMHFYAWEKGLKTGMYYLRSTSSLQATKIVCEGCSG